MFPWYYYALFALSYFLVVIPINWIGMALFDKRFSWRSHIVIWVIYTFENMLSGLVLQKLDGYMALDLITFICSFILLAWLAYGKRGFRAFTSGVLYCLACALSSFVVYGLTEAAAIPGGKTSELFSREFIVYNALCLVYYIPVAAIFLYACRLFRKRYHANQPWVYIVRPAIQVPISVAVGAIAMQYVRKLGLDEQGNILLSMCILVCVSVQLTLAVVYMFQDIKLLSMARKNESLTAQQRIYDALLNDARAFRHNIANMLCGFEGAILTGDIANIQAYYAEMAENCARINNENIVALNRVPRAAVCAVLLKKLDAAAKIRLPMYMLASENLIWRGLSDSDMAAVLGVLIDNAIEAAQACPTPYVAVEFSNIEGAMEVVVRNTYDKQTSDLGFLAGDIHTSKQAHEGIGLMGVRDIISKYPKAALNQIKRGRYVESLLLIE